MSRFSTPVTSVAALAVDTAFAALVPAAAGGGKLRRVTIGVTAAGVPTSQQATVAINRGTARGTATTTLTPQRTDPNSVPPVFTGVDTVWSTPPTLAAQDYHRISFNTQVAYDLPWEFLEELTLTSGTANPLVFVNRNNALPTGHSFTLTIEHEE